MQEEHHPTDAIAADPEAAAREREVFVLAMEASGAAEWIWDVVTGHVRFSERHARMLGYGLHELVPHYSTWEHLLHPEDRPAVLETLQAHLEGRTEAFDSEHRLRRKDGSCIWSHAHGRVLQRDAAGRPLRMAGTDIDVTLRRQHEERIRESEARLRAIFDHVQAGILLVDAETHRILEVNPVAARWIGLPAGSIVGRICHSFVCPATEGRCPITDLGQQIDASERTLLTAGGEIVPILKTVVPVTLHGRPVLLESFIDIRDHKRIEAERDARLERLQRQQAVLAEISRDPSVTGGQPAAALPLIAERAAECLQVARVSVWLLGADRRELRCCELYQNPPGRHSAGSVLAVGDCRRLLDALETERIIHSSDALSDDRLKELLDSHLRPNGITSLLAGAVRLGERLDGIVFASHVGSPRAWHADEIRFIGELADQVAQTLANCERSRIERELRHSHAAALTALDRERQAGMRLEAATRELAAAVRAAQAASRAKSEFLANMSHEIRTPLTAILGYARLLMQDSPSSGRVPGDLRNALAIIERSGQHLLTLIDDILDLSRIEAGRLEIEAVPCQVCQIIHEATAIHAARIDERRLTLNVTLDGPVPRTIRTDPTRLRQILVNLIGNAVKFTPHGSIEIRVSCDRSDEAGPMLAVLVRDSGVGMPPGEIERVFEPFDQVDGSTTRRYGGTGLGLTISRRLARMLGGDVRIVRTAPEQGTDVLVTVAAGPLDGADMIETYAPPEPPLSPPPRPRAAPVLRGARILLVEDGEDNREFLVTVLTRAGAEVEVAVNGQEGVEKAMAALENRHDQDARPRHHAILMDMQMPVMDGYEATRRLRSAGLTVPIIALTAHAMAVDRDRCLSAGCTEYLSKPVDPDQLCATVAGLLPASGIASAGRPESASPADGTTVNDDTDGEMAALVARFLGRLEQRVSELQDALALGDFQALRALSHKLKGASGSYGFPGITTAAAGLEKAIDARADVDELRRRLEMLAGACRAAADPLAQAPPPRAG